MRVFKKNSNIFHLLSEAVVEGTIVVNQEFLIVSMNRRAEELFGYDPDELKGKPLSQIIPISHKKKHEKHVSDFFSQGKQGRMAEGRSLFGLKKSGEEFPMEVGLNPFTIYQRKYVLALVYDMTQTLEYRRKLNVRGQALKFALNGVVITDARQKDNPVIYFNEAFQKLTGYKRDEIIGQNCRFLQGTDRNQEGIKKIRKAIKEGKSCRVEVRNYKKDGTLFWNEVSINPIRDVNGVITHFVGIQNDITQRVKSEQEIIHLIKIFNDSLNEIYVFDAESLLFTHANFGAQKGLGYKLMELKNMTPLDLQPEFTQKQFSELIQPLLTNSHKKVEYETINRRNDGSTYPVEVHLQSSSLDGRTLVVAIVMDISDRKNYTQKLENTVLERTEQLQEALIKEKELGDLKTKFLSLVSHEFKTPLSAILTSATLVGKYTEVEQQDKRDKHLKSIAAEVQHLTSILNDFLSVERLEQGKEVYKMTDFHLSKVVNEVIYNANMLLKSGQKIDYPLNIEDVRIHQDEKIVALTLTNLLNNAIKYSPENTTIYLEVEICDESIGFLIRDEGIGIPEEDQKHIFERYFRAENVLTTQGTGIGLNIVKNHLENLGGSINFESQENIGSVFKVILPLELKPVK
ncbi:MAG: PAS domain S-box protein [Flavobacteriaceae bacterium]